MEDICARFLKKAFNLPCSFCGSAEVEAYADPFVKKSGLQSVKFKNNEITFTFDHNSVMVFDETQLYAIYRVLKHLEWFEWVK